MRVYRKWGSKNGARKTGLAPSSTHEVENGTPSFKKPPFFRAPFSKHLYTEVENGTRKTGLGIFRPIDITNKLIKAGCVWGVFGLHSRTRLLIFQRQWGGSVQMYVCKTLAFMCIIIARFSSPVFYTPIQRKHGSGFFVLQISRIN